MLSASKGLKRVVVPRWRTRRFLCVSSFSSSPCSYHSFNHGVTDLRLNKLHLTISYPLTAKYITSTPVEVLSISPCSSYYMLSTSMFKGRRSLATQASSKEEEVAYQVLDDIVSGLKKSPGSVNELCNDHINELCRKRKLHAAAKLLQLLRDKHGINSLPAYNHLLAAAGEETDMEIVSCVFKDMLLHQQSVNSTTYFNVAKAVSKNNDSTLVLAFVEEILQLTSTASVMIVNRMIYAFAECGHVNNVILVFDQMRNLKCKPDLITYNTMLGILGKSGRVDEMLDVFAAMKKANIGPDIVSYNTLLNSLRKVGRFDLCVVLLREMGTVGVQPDLRTYTALVECFGRSGNVEESLRLFEDMKRWCIRPSIYIYRSLISNLKRVGKSDLAGKLSEEMNECLDDLVGPKDFKKKNR